MSRLARVLGAVVFSLVFVPAAQTQIVGLKHLSTVPGVLNTGSELRTVVACTNGDTAGATIGVDVYGPAGAFVDGNSIPVAPGATAIFSTDFVANLSIDVDLTIGPMTKGHARIFGGSSKVTCSAFIADGSTGLPSASLTITKKFSQKGD